MQFPGPAVQREVPILTGGIARPQRLPLWLAGGPGTLEGARALGDQVRRALDHEGAPRDLVEQSNCAHDPVYAILRQDGGFLTMEQIRRRLPQPMDVPAFERHLAHLRQDFSIDTNPRKTGDAYRLGDFKAFVGQDDHLRHEAFLKPTKIS